MTLAHANRWKGILIRVFALVVGCLVPGCEQPDNGTYSRHDTGFAPEYIRIENDSAWIGPSDRMKEHRILRNGEKIRIETLEGTLRGNYRVYKNGLLCIDTNTFYQKGEQPP